MFYFEQVLRNALDGVDTNVTGAVLQLAGVILLLSLLFSVYEAYSQGGDLRLLGVAAIKYLALGLVFANYPQVFRSVNSMFNSVADFIYNLNGMGDLVENWLNALSNYVSNQGIPSFWDLITGGFAGLLDVLLIAIGMIVLPVSYTLFTLAYAAYGSVLYVAGPIVLALLPSRSLGHIGRTYLVNLMIFQSWGLLYAILQVLMTAINMDTMNNVLNQDSVLNAFVGSSEMLLLGVASILLSLAVLLIPFIASRIVRGDVGSTMLSVVSVASNVASWGMETAFGVAKAGGGEIEAGAPPVMEAGVSGGYLGRGMAEIAGGGGSLAEGVAPEAIGRVEASSAPRAAAEAAGGAGLVTEAREAVGTAAAVKPDRQRIGER